MVARDPALPSSQVMSAGPIPRFLATGNAAANSAANSTNYVCAACTITNTESSLANWQFHSMKGDAECISLFCAINREKQLKG